MNQTTGSLMRAIRGPILLIALGVLFTLDQFTTYGLRQTWPVLLILYGLLKLLERLAARDGGPAYLPPAPSSQSHSGGGQ